MVAAVFDQSIVQRLFVFFFFGVVVFAYPGRLICGLTFVKASHVSIIVLIIVRAVFLL